MNTVANRQEQEGLVARPPAASSFAVHPASWYFFCHTTELRKGPLARRILNRDLVAFRTESGKVAVLDARCSHLGANLGRGQVVGETIRCPFHHWRFGCSGQCEHIPGTKDIPAFAHQRSYPVAQRHGVVFFFNAQDALFPLPFFDGELPGDLAAARAFAYTAQAPWFMVAAQGFDRQHFESVHDRRLLEPPQVDSPNPFVRRNRWRAEIIGQSVRDRILRAFVGKTVSLTINNWGGTVFVVKAEFPRASSRFLVSCRPLEGNRTHFDVIVFARRGLPALSLAARRWFTRGHLVAEANQIRDTQYRPARLIAADADMIECFRWLASLRQRSSSTTEEETIRHEHNGERLDQHSALI